MEQALFGAIEALDLEALRRAINGGADVNAVCREGDNAGATPILVAVLSNSFESREMIAELVGAGADKDAIDGPKLKFTPLHHAANLGISNGAWALLRQGADPMRKDVVGRNPMHYAGMKSFLGIFEMLVFAGGDPTVGADVDGHTAETYAAMKSGLEIGEEFHVIHLAYGQDRELFSFFASIMRGDETAFRDMVAVHGQKQAAEIGVTGLMVAALAGRRAMGAELLAAGADVNAQDRHGATALARVLASCDHGFLELLLAHGANPDLPDDVGNTPLINGIVSATDLEITKTLISESSDVSWRNSWGETALYAAAQGHSLELVERLFDAGADASVVTNDGSTVLISAARTTNPEIIRELVSRGAELHRPLNDGWQPIHVACEVGNLESLKVFVELGADRDAKTNDGQRPVDIASDCGFDELVEFLGG